jgi:hypothetical protein
MALRKKLKAINEQLTYWVLYIPTNVFSKFYRKYKIDRLIKQQQKLSAEMLLQVIKKTKKV